MANFKAKRLPKINALVSYKWYLLLLLFAYQNKLYKAVKLPV